MESELADIFGVTVRPSADTADAIYDQVAETLRRAGLPAAGAAGAVRHRGAGHHRRPVRRPRAPRGDPRRRRRSRPGCSRPSGPTATSSRPAPTGRSWSTRSARRRTSTPATTRATSPRWRTAGGTSSRTAPSRPTTATPTSRTDPLEPAEAERIYAAARAGAATPDEATALRRHLLLEMARMSVDDGLVMTLHPGVHRNHHTPDLRRASAPTSGCDIPIAVEFTRGAAAAAGALRHRRGLPARAVHPRRDRVLPRDRARSPASTRASTRARRGGSSTRPRRSAATAAPSPRPPASPAPPASSTTPGPSAPSRPATTCPAASTAASWPSSSPSTASTRTRPWRPPRPRDHQPAEGVQAVTGTSHRSAAEPRPRRPTGRPRADRAPRHSATSSAPTRPGTPNTPPTPREWGIAAFSGRMSPDSGRTAQLAAQDGLYTLVVRAADGDRPEMISSLSQVSGPLDDWRRCFGRPELALVTITVTEAGYRRTADGGLDTADPEVAADVAALAPSRHGRRRRHRPRQARARARRAPRTGPAGPGRRALRQRAGQRRRWRRGWSASWPRPPTPTCATGSPRTSRSSPRWSTASPRGPPTDDRARLRAGPASTIRCRWSPSPSPSGCWPGTSRQGRPRWEDAGARFVDDVAPFEQRKLWLLNGSHSLMAYAGTIRGHETVEQAISDLVVPRRGSTSGGTTPRGTCRCPPRTSRRTGPRCSSATRTRASAICWPRSPPTARRSCPIRILPTVQADVAAGARAAGRRARARRLGVPPARRAARRWPTSPPTSSSRWPQATSTTPSDGC